MNHTKYISNPVQDSCSLEIADAISSKLQAAAGGWVSLHGETLSGLTTILHRLWRSRFIGSSSPWLLRMTPTPHLMGIKAALLHSMRLPNESTTWTNTTVIPRFLNEFLINSKTKVMLIDDFHITQKLSKKENSVLLSIIHELMEPPLSIVFVLAGNFSRFQPRTAGWRDFNSGHQHIIQKLKLPEDVQKFSNAFLGARGLALNNLMPCPLVSADDASAILEVTKGYVGEVVTFLSIFAREYQCVECWAVSARAFSRANSRYRPRNG